MPRDLVRTGSLVLALLGATALSAGNAVAQQQQPPAEPQQQQQQEKAQQTPSGQMGKEEPSSHAPSAKPADNSVFVNGALAVPGAPENTDTVPAKFSEQNAADDKLSIAAYTFKLLTEEQRRAIYTALKGQPAGPAFNADIGAELPSSVELRPMPDDVVARVQQTKDYRYAVADNRVLLVSPVTRYVVGIFVDDVQAPKAGEGTPHAVACSLRLARARNDAGGMRKAWCRADSQGLSQPPQPGTRQGHGQQTRTKTRHPERQSPALSL